jgi:hypothetical protein
LSNKIGVRYDGEIYDYPIQNNVGSMPIGKWMKLWWSYIFKNRKLANSANYADWVRGNYGDVLADEVILPHTWKTLKEDLYGIDVKSYGKKVVPMSLFNIGGSGVQEIIDPDKIFSLLGDFIKSRTEEVEAQRIDLGSKFVLVKNHKNNSSYQIHYDLLINTISLPKFLSLISEGDLTEEIQVARKTLRYNNMFVALFVVPTSFVNTERDIVYFPERKFVFSKVTITRDNGISAISCEVSFRSNDNELFTDELYTSKFMERVEQDLKKSGLLRDNMFICYWRQYKIVSPAYIICDENYQSTVDFVQGWLHHHNISCIGRFASWEPHLRIESTLKQLEEIDYAKDD